VQRRQEVADTLQAHGVRTATGTGTPTHPGQILGCDYTAARAIASVGDSSYQTLKALTTALEMPGDSSRHIVAGALSRVTGKKWFYSTSAGKAEKDQVLDRWRKWWAANRDALRRAGEE
ncbi:hypothetical protein LCGC14_3126060, partial [marine sediment metagenome]